MAIKQENRSTEELLRDARFHWAALTADPRTAATADGIEKATVTMKAASANTEECDKVRMYCQAVFQRSDFELDALVRLVELDVEGAVHKDRRSAGYRAVFPNGLEAVTKLRGEEQAREVARMRGAMQRHFPQLHQKHAAELEGLEKVTIEAEKAWKQADARATNAFAEEVEERRRLVEAMQKSEGALQILLPGQKNRVRSFFRPEKNGRVVHSAQILGTVVTPPVAANQ